MDINYKEGYEAEGSLKQNGYLKNYQVHGMGTPTRLSISHHIINNCLSNFIEILENMY